MCVFICNSVNRFLVSCLYAYIFCSLVFFFFFFFGGESVCDNTVYFYILNIRLLISIQNPKRAYMFSCPKENTFLKEQYNTAQNITWKHKGSKSPGESRVKDDHLVNLHSPECLADCVICSTQVTRCPQSTPLSNRQCNALNLIS